MARPPCVLTRLWRLYAGPNPLLRPCDRAERILVGFILLVALTAVPIAATAGAEDADQGVQRAHIETRTRYQSTATTLQPAPVLVASEAPVATTDAAVAATWTAPDGTTRTGNLSVTPATPQGAEVSIWTDRSGNPMAEPHQPAAAVAAGVVHGILVWLAFLGVLATLYGLAHLVLNRVRFTNWTREWEYLQHDAPD
jgi:hypothetical protein